MIPQFDGIRYDLWFWAYAWFEEYVFFIYISSLRVKQVRLGFSLESKRVFRILNEECWCSNQSKLSNLPWFNHCKKVSVSLTNISWLYGGECYFVYIYKIRLKSEKRVIRLYGSECYFVCIYKIRSKSNIRLKMIGLEEDVVGIE